MQLTVDQVAEYEARGFLFFSALFEAEEIAQLRREVPAILAADRPEIDREEGSDRVRCAFACHTYSEGFRRLSRHPRIVEPVRQLLAGDIYMHQFSINPKVAFDGEAWEWHQDYGAWAKDDGMPETRAVNTGLFLDEVTQFNGPLFFIPGSHRHGLLPSVRAPAKRFPAWTLERETVARLIAEGGLVSPQGPAGSLWIFHPNLVHASSPNMSPHDRMIVTQCYAHVANHIRTPRRPEWVAHTDFTPLAPLADDCLQVA